MHLSNIGSISSLYATITVVKYDLSLLCLLRRLEKYIPEACEHNYDFGKSCVAKINFDVEARISVDIHIRQSSEITSYTSKCVLPLFERLRFDLGCSVLS